MSSSYKTDTLTTADIKALTWAVSQAASWRGTMTGNPDPQPLAEFDAYITLCRGALRRARNTKKQLVELKS